MSNATIKKLQEHIEELKEEIRQLREDMIKDACAFTHILTRQQSALLMALYRRSPATYAYLDHITEQFGAYNRFDGEMHISLRTRVAMWKLRRKLKPFGVAIHVMRGTGYYLDGENKAKLLALMGKIDETWNSGDRAA